MILINPTCQKCPRVVICFECLFLGSTLHSKTARYMELLYRSKIILLRNLQCNSSTKTTFRTVQNCFWRPLLETTVWPIVGWSDCWMLVRQWTQHPSFGRATWSSHIKNIYHQRPEASNPRSQSPDHRPDSGRLSFVVGLHKMIRGASSDNRALVARPSADQTTLGRNKYK